MVPILRPDPSQKEAVYAVDNGPCWYGASPVGTFLVTCHDGQKPVGQFRSGQTFAAILHGRDGRVRVLGDRVSAHKAMDLCRAQNKHLQSLNR
jgi:hypothetical protein